MKISKKDLSNFQLLYKKQFGIDLPIDQALDKGTRLLRLMELVYRPMTEKEFASLQERRLLLQKLDKQGSLKNTDNK